MSPAEPDPRCPGCGLTPDELRDGGQMGCPRCYDAPALRPLIEEAARELHGVAPAASAPPSSALTLPWPTRRGQGRRNP